MFGVTALWVGKQRVTRDFHEACIFMSFLINYVFINFIMKYALWKLHCDALVVSRSQKIFFFCVSQLWFHGSEVKQNSLSWSPEPQEMWGKSKFDELKIGEALSSHFEWSPKRRGQFEWDLYVLIIWTITITHTKKKLCNTFFLYQWSDFRAVSHNYRLYHLYIHILNLRGEFFCIFRIHFFHGTFDDFYFRDRLQIKDYLNCFTSFFNSW